ncbi:MAG TPA: sugar kinase [Alphaproteobacteria bacterium]|nr:sugar kinase [Alphaproteobacteria bacterium]
MKRLAFIGECMIELTDTGGSGGGATQRGFGGDSLNSAVYAARCLAGEDMAVAYVTILGDDPFSDEMLAAWRAEGVGTELVMRRAGALPGLYAIRTDSSGERSFHYWRSESPARALFADAGAAALAAALVDFDLLYVSGITLAIMAEAGRARLLETLALARSRGGRVAFDSNYRPLLWPDIDSARRQITRGAAAATLVLSSFDDERALFGDPSPEVSAQRLHALGAGEVVIKNGPGDCLVSLAGDAEKGQWRIAPPTVAHPVDTTAAGDSFNAAYIAARMLGAAPGEAAKRGAELAARVIQQQGAIVDAP